MSIPKDIKEYSLIINEDLYDHLSYDEAIEALFSEVDDYEETNLDLGYPFDDEEEA